ncbi:MAG: hypothetical protein ABI592_06045 [Acidobacteriota bacterium]
MATRRGSSKSGKAAKKSVSNLPAKRLKADQAKRVKGGAVDVFAKLGDIKGESLDSKRRGY